MSPSNNGKIVLVTGINGFIASHIGYNLLRQNYIVRGTTRSKKSADALLEGAYAPYAQNVQMVQVADMTIDGAFDEAVKDTSIILHTAAPISYTLTSPTTTIVPARRAALSILNSALRHAGPSLSSFVFTSSVAACADPSKPSPYTFTEKDWNEWSEAKIAGEGFNDLGDDEKARTLYPASKTIAEREVWNWRDENRPAFAITAINPTIVYGPPLQPPPHPDQINETLKGLWGMISGQCDHISRPTPTSGYVDVRDVAAIHVYAALHPDESGGQRSLIAAGRAPSQAMADVIRKNFPSYRSKIPEGNPGADYAPDFGWIDGGVSIDSSRTRKALGLGEGGKEWVGFEQSVIDTVKVFERVYGEFL